MLTSDLVKKHLEEIRENEFLRQQRRLRMIRSYAESKSAMLRERAKARMAAARQEGRSAGCSPKLNKD